MLEPENGNVQVGVRRRRTRRHRRNRLVRRFAAGALLGLLTVAASTFAFMHLSPSLFRGQTAPSALQRLEDARSRTSAVDQILAHSEPPRPVYPYSVVPGGVEDVRELKWVAEHDPIVGAHYAGFNYARAQVVRLTLARTVYVSYRIGNRIYWTRRRVKLKKGEKLITDGKITARSRCGNQVDETPHEQASPSEPMAEKFDEPMLGGEGTAMQSPPAAFQSALLSRPQVPGLGPAAPLGLYDPFTGGSFVPLSPPPLPTGLCGPVKKKGSTETPVEDDTNGKKKKVGACGTTETVPEPGTWVMLVSGLAAIYWQARRKPSRA